MQDNGGVGLSLGCRAVLQKNPFHTLSDTEQIISKDIHTELHKLHTSIYRPSGVHVYIRRSDTSRGLAALWT